MALYAHKPIDKICNNQCHAKFQSLSDFMLLPTYANYFCKSVGMFEINGNLDIIDYLRKYLFARKF
jgi:hypothetical protein